MQVHGPPQCRPKPPALPFDDDEAPGGKVPELRLVFRCLHTGSIEDHDQRICPVTFLQVLRIPHLVFPKILIRLLLEIAHLVIAVRQVPAFDLSSGRHRLGVVSQRSGCKRRLHECEYDEYDDKKQDDPQYFQHFFHNAPH